MTTLYEISPEFFNDILSVITSGVIHKVILHPVKYTHIIKDITEFTIQRIRERFDYYFDFELEDQITIEQKEKCMELLKQNLWKTPVIKGFTRFHISSNQTGNNDTRGGGCGYLGFTTDDFKLDVELDSDVITLQDITEAIYRLKGSKYDWNYELYCDIVATIDNENHTISFLPNFDYGS